MFSSFTERDPIIDMLVSADPNLDEKDIIHQQIPDHIIESYPAQDTDFELDPRDEIPFPDVIVDLDRSSKNCDQLKKFQIETNDHLKYSYYYLEPIHLHDYIDRRDGFVNYAVPESFGQGCSPGDYDEIIKESIINNTAGVRVKGIQMNEFDWSPLPLCSYVQWIPMAKARKWGCREGSHEVCLDRANQ